jgi:hypothetical protein
VNRPEGSTWGDFGPDDQLGRLNLITPAKVLQGIAEVREGKSFCLSLPLDYPGKNVLNPRRLPPVLRPTSRSGKPNMNYVLANDDPNMTDVICDDLVIMHLQYSTQWDSRSRCSTTAFAPASTSSAQATRRTRASRVLSARHRPRTPRR